MRRFTLQNGKFVEQDVGDWGTITHFATMHNGDVVPFDTYIEDNNVRVSLSIDPPQHVAKHLANTYARKKPSLLKKLISFFTIAILLTACHSANLDPCSTIKINCKQDQYNEYIRNCTASTAQCHGEAFILYCEIEK
jgi:hypothetical protein